MEMGKLLLAVLLVSVVAMSSGRRVPSPSREQRRQYIQLFIEERSLARDIRNADCIPSQWNLPREGPIDDRIEALEDRIEDLQSELEDCPGTQATTPAEEDEVTSAEEDEVTSAEEDEVASAEEDEDESVV